MDFCFRHKKLKHILVDSILFDLSKSNPSLTHECISRPSGKYIFYQHVYTQRVVGWRTSTPWLLRCNKQYSANFNILFGLLKFQVIIFLYRKNINIWDELTVIIFQKAVLPVEIWKVGQLLFLNWYPHEDLHKNLNCYSQNNYLYSLTSIKAQKNRKIRFPYLYE